LDYQGIVVVLGEGGCVRGCGKLPQKWQGGGMAKMKREGIPRFLCMKVERIRRINRMTEMKKYPQRTIISDIDPDPVTVHGSNHELLQTSPILLAL